MHSYLLQDEFGQILEAESISAGLDYPGVGPEHAYLADTGRASYYVATDEEVLDALQLLARTEGIIPALEPAHALAWLVGALKRGQVPAGATVLLTMSGRGDKDAEQVMQVLGS
jgi:tryptophan synthase beta chain